LYISAVTFVYIFNIFLRAREPWGQDVKWPTEIYLGGQTQTRLTPDFWKDIFWYTGQLILSKIIRIVATGCQIFKLKCTKFDFGRGFRPRAHRGSLPGSPGP